jgi:beta-glucosidase
VFLSTSWQVRRNYELQRLHNVLRSSFAAALAAFLVMPSGLHSQQVQVPLKTAPSNLDSTDLEDRVSALLARMTLQEKIGQLVQYSAGNATGPDPKRAEYEEMIRKGDIGSLLNVIGTDQTNRYQHIAVEKSRLHIPLLFGYDVIHGYRTSFPIPLGLAAGFSPKLIEEVGETASDEARQEGVDWLFSPMVDIARDARWGRIAESAGEDPYLGAAIARAWVQGIQHKREDGTMTAASVKHFAAYGAPIAGRDYNAVDMSQQMLHQVYLPPYRAGVDAGALTVMSSFNSLNGVPASANRSLLTDTLRTEWGFRGMVVSDWGAVRELLNHSIALDGATAASKALHAGVDMDMEGDLYRTQLAELVQDGRVPLAEIDEAVRRVLRVKFAIGLFDHPYTETAPPPYKASSAKRALARRIAADTLVLLKNDSVSGDHPLLPITASYRSIALIGPLADSQTDMIGSWSSQADPHDAVTLRSALAERIGDKLRYARGTEILTDSTAGFAEAEALARQADVVVMALGESGPDMTGESTSRAHIGLPGNQEQLLEAVARVGKPVVLVLFSGRPLAIPWAAQHVSSILEAWFPGTEAGHAITDVLFGDRSPSGRLPVSFPYSVGQEPLFYAQLPTGRPATQDLTGPVHKGVSRFSSRYIDEATVPLYPFGWGLTYTTFSYGTPKLSSKELELSKVQSAVTAGDSTKELIGVDTTLTNTGSASGTEVMQLYIRNQGASVEQPVKELRSFTRVELQPHETRTVHFSLSAQDLAFYDQNVNHVVEPTRYTVFVGSNAGTTNAAQFTITP